MGELTFEVVAPVAATWRGDPDSMTAQRGPAASPAALRQLTQRAPAGRAPMRFAATTCFASTPQAGSDAGTQTPQSGNFVELR